MASYNYNVQVPTLHEVDKTIRSLADLKIVNGHQYVTISASDGRKLMQRIVNQTPQAVEKVLARGHDDIQEEDVPNFIIVESKKLAERKRSQFFGSEYIYRQFEAGKYEITSLKFYQAILAEFIGVYILTLVVCAIGISLNKNNPSKTPSINGALGGGLTLGTMIWCMNCISGGNLNPAISIALVVTNELLLIRGIFYIFSQLLGAYMGSVTLNFLLPEAVRANVGLTLLNQHISIAKGFGVEFMITFLLAITVFASIDKTRKDLNGSIPLSIGLSVTCGALFGVSLSHLLRFSFSIHYLIF
jgi:glycerol uptake facilitator-like aquaporin